jgi:hypothetical protein
MAGIWWLKFLYMARASGSHVYRVYKMWGFSLLLILPLLGVFCNLLILRMLQRYLSNLLALIHFMRLYTERRRRGFVQCRLAGNRCVSVEMTMGGAALPG